MCRILFTALAAATIGLAFATGAASAKEKIKPAPLPGVEAGYSIVKPIPEPEPDEAADTANSDRHFKVGNTEVRIGGYVRVDIGTGRLPRH